MGTMFVSVMVLSLINGFYIYLSSWGSQETAFASYGFVVSPLSTLERTVAVFLACFAIMNGFAAFYGSKSFRMLVSFLNTFVASHCFVEAYVGDFRGGTLLLAVVFLYLSFYYYMTEFDEDRGRKNKPLKRREPSFVSAIANRHPSEYEVERCR